MNQRQIESAIGFDLIARSQEIKTPYSLTEEGRGLILLDLTDDTQRKMYDAVKNFILNGRLNEGQQ